MRIGTRGSALARAQAQLVAELLGGGELVTITTSGDRDVAATERRDATPASRDAAATEDRDATPADPADATTADSADAVSADTPGTPSASDKSRWVHELELALRAGEIDLAVHSAKDVPGKLATGLALLGAPARATVDDVLCGAGSLDELAHGARIGTSSVRRAAQLRAAREDLDVVALRGNVDTRLRKLDAGACDALVLARAGLQRLGCEARAGATLDPARFVPSPGQGTLALQGRADDAATRAAVRAITDAETFACLRAERALAHALGASCHTPLGAWAAPVGCGCLHLRAWVGLPDGSAWLADELFGGFYDAYALGRRLADRMATAGARDLLSEAEGTAVGRA